MSWNASIPSPRFTTVAGISPAAILQKTQAPGIVPFHPGLAPRGQLAPERLAQLLPELLAGVPFRGRLALDLGELLEQGALLRGQLDGRPDMDAHVEIAATPFPDARQPLATQTVHRTGLRAGCDLQGRVAVRRRDPNLRAEGRLGERDREVVNQVVALALEPWILGDVQHGDQVAGRTIAGPGDAVSPHGEVVGVGDARGDV